jgi:hypothetical protein
VNRLPNFSPTWNIAPTQDAIVVRRHPETGDRPLQWGLLPYFSKHPVHAKRPINARAETVKTSGLFRSAFFKRKRLAPAEAFYEWKPVTGEKQPYAIARQDGQPMALAGTVTPTFAIITTCANEIIGESHGCQRSWNHRIGQRGWERSRPNSVGYLIAWKRRRQTWWAARHDKRKAAIQRLRVWRAVCYRPP